MTIEIHQGSGNVYADLEFPDAEAMQAKAQLVVGLSQMIQSRQWSQYQAAAVIGVAASELALIMRGHFRSYRVVDLENLLKRASRES